MSKDPCTLCGREPRVRCGAPECPQRTDSPFEGFVYAFALAALLVVALGCASAGPLTVEEILASEPAVKNRACAVTVEDLNPRDKSVKPVRLCPPGAYPVTTIRGKCVLYWECAPASGF